MKTTILKTTCILATLIGLTISANAETLNASIPFDFTVGAKSMPAGDYIFSVESSGVLLIRGTARGLGGVMVAVQADSALAQPLAGAAFDRSASATVLSRITLPSGGVYRVMPTFRSARLVPVSDSGVLLSRH